MIFAMAELDQGHFDAAIDEYHKAIDAGFRSFYLTQFTAAYALEGKMDEAKTALAEARRLNPKLTVKWLIGMRRTRRPCSKGCVRRGCRRSERNAARPHYQHKAIPVIR